MLLTKIELTDIPSYDLGDLLLRPIKESDYQDMFAYGSDEEVTKMLSWNAFTSPLQAKEAIRKFFLSRPSNQIPSAHAIVHKGTNQMIGTCDFPGVDWDRKVATLGYCMHRAYWGKGYMTRVVKALFPFAFEYLKLDAIKVQHHPDNIGSKKVIIKSGFTYKNDEYNRSLDLILPTYVLTKEEYLKSINISTSCI